jgi:hypothetical protein
MTMHEPNPEVRPIGDEAAEYVEDPSDPPPPSSPDPTGEARDDRAVDPSDHEG